VAPFACLVRLDRGKVIGADAGMRVDVAKGGVLALKMLDHQRQHGMLLDVGEISGVIGVSIIHGAGLWAKSRAGASPMRRRPLYLWLNRSVICLSTYFRFIAEG